MEYWWTTATSSSENTERLSVCWTLTSDLSPVQVSWRWCWTGGCSRTITAALVRASPTTSWQPVSTTCCWRTGGAVLRWGVGLRWGRGLLWLLPHTRHSCCVSVSRGRDVTSDVPVRGEQPETWCLLHPDRSIRTSRADTTCLHLRDGPGRIRQPLVFWSLVEYQCDGAEDQYQSWLWLFLCYFNFLQVIFYLSIYFPDRKWEEPQWNTCHCSPTCPRSLSATRQSPWSPQATASCQSSAPSCHSARRCRATFTCWTWGRWRTHRWERRLETPGNTWKHLQTPGFMFFMLKMKSRSH